MLADWYFCCCIKASPSTTKAFLSILETLRNPESDSQLLYLTYEELRRTDVWMQMYALPQVLESLYRQGLPAGIHNATIKRYFDGLIENLPKRVEETFKNLIGMILDEVEPHGIIKALAEGVKASQRHDSEMRTPYLDLKEFLPQTLMMAVIANQSEHNREFAIALELELDKKDSPVKSLLEHSLDYKFGRLAFRMAVRISDLTEFESAEDLVSRIGETPFSMAPLEPDLLDSYASVLIQENLRKTNQDKTATVIKIVGESLTLQELRRLKRATRHRKNDNSSWDEWGEPLRRIGLQPNQYSEDNFPIVYWQSILWELAVQLEPRTTAAELGKFWQPPGELPERVEAKCPSKRDSKRDAEEWEEQLISLLSVRPNRVSIDVEKTQKHFSLPDESKWIFGSPWINRRDRIEYQDKDKRRYPTAERPENMVRLIVGLCLAIRLLQAKTKPYRVEFSKLIAHASDVINKTYGKWLKSYNKDKNEQKGITQLTLPLTGLALFGKRQIHLVGTGKMESISPKSFVEILRNHENPSDEAKIPSGDEKEFLKSVLPEVLMSWIADGYTSAVGQNRSARWLKLIPEVYNYHKEGKHDFPVSQEAALVMRFLRPNGFTDYTRFDWRTQINPNSWKVNHRALLLTEPGLPTVQWHKPEWDETDLSQSSRLVRALERLASLTSLSDGEPIPSKMQGWQDEWEEYLNRVSKTEELDRFTRLRLLELLRDNSIKWKSPDAQKKLIAYTLLEYGSLYDLDKMMSWVYSTDANENSPAGAELQETLLQAMYKFLASQNSLKLVEGRNQRTVQDPEETRIDLQQAEFFQATIAKVIYFSWKTGNRRLSQAIETICKRSRESSITTNPRVKHCDIELQGTHKHIIQPSNNDSIADWSIKAVVYDSNKLTTTIFYNDFELSEIENLFEKSEREIEPLKNRGRNPLYVLAVVVEFNPLADNKFEYKFNCGFYFYLTLTITGKLNGETGDYVGLHIQYQDNRWKVHDENPICQLLPRLQAGDIDSLSITEHWIPRNKQRTLRLIRGSERIAENPEDVLWDADISRSFRDFPKQEQPQVFAQYTGENKWVPVDRDFNDLLLNAFNDLNSNIAVLTLIGEADGQFGKKAWRFSTQPGENYILEQHQFVEDDAKALEKVIADLDKETREHNKRSPGLLIAVKPDNQNDTVRLALVSNQVSNTNSDTFYPNLRRPFDERNIEWRELFSDSDQDYIADNEGDDKWYYHLDENIAPGYPKKVRVYWDRSRPNPEAQKAEFIVDKKRWDWRKAAVYAEHIPSNKITLPRDEDWQKFLARWLNIKEGARVSLTKAIGQINRGGNGFIPCLTRENIWVQVEAESLTMRAIEHEGRPQIDSPREAEVFRINFTTEPLNIDIDDTRHDDLRHKVLENAVYCEGILIQVPKGERGSFCTVVWEIDDQPVFSQIWIGNVAELRIRPGSKIIGKQQKGSRWEFRIEFRSFLVRALWKKTELQGRNNQLQYLGIPENQRQAIAELQPGEFVFLPRIPENTNHLAIGDGRKFQNGLEVGYRTKNTYSGNPWQEAGNKYQRAVLTLNENGLLIGNCIARTSNENLSLTRVLLKLSEKNDNLFDLRREFRLREVSETKPRNDNQETDSDNPVWKERLEKYWDSPYDLEASFNPSDTRVKLKINQLERAPIKVQNSEVTGWTLWVRLAPNEGAYVAEGKYSDDAKVRLFKDNQDRIWASLRQVTPSTPDEFKTELGAGFNDSFKLEPTKLYYVGLEPNKTEHRFEMGYGKTLVVPESHLRFNNGNFKQAELLIFHGDLITHITFLLNEAEGATECIINIDKVNIQFSFEGRSLYDQRKKYQIVHMLHLKTSGNRVEITSVDGFDETSTEPDKTKRSFNRVRAKLKLTEDSERRLLNRLQESADNSEEEYVIFGRLDHKEYEASWGQEILFEHVRLSFDTNPEEAYPLENNEMVFLQADCITGGGNDMGLQLSPPEKLLKNDIGADMERRIWLRRRQFSVREDLLSRFSHTEDGRNYFKGDTLLVRLQRFEQRQLVPSLMDRPPVRKASVLAGVIDNSSALELATVANVSERGEVSIELKPGIFVNLEPEDVELPPNNLRRGAIVRIEKIMIDTSYKFRLTPAAFGDLRYVPSDGLRPVVTLPKNNLFEPSPWESGEVNDDNYWQQDQRKRSFSIGGLPNIQASPGWYNPTQSAWRNPRANDFVQLMQAWHPKIACAGKDHQGFVKITPLSADFPVGSLLLENSFNVKYVPLGKTADDRECRDLSWLELSFRDESVRSIIASAKLEHWSYHDKYTQTWMPDSGEFQRENLNSHSVTTGPLFFQLHNNKPRLRYTATEFLRFGLPVEELISALKQKPKPLATYPVAGISEQQGLWIELAPGRIVELPAQLVVAWGTEKSLAKLNWKNFAPGDKVQLQVVSSNPLEIERVALKNWIPGPRKAFGSQRCFLPVQKDKSKKGAITLGHGLFTLTLPKADIEPSWQTVVLTPDNSLLDINAIRDSERQPVPGDAVLLSINDAGRLILLGLETLTPDLVKDATNAIEPEALTDLLNAIGNALPITVEQVSEGTLFFSLRQQNDAAKLPVGRVTQARVVGVLPDNRTVLLRCGGGLIKMCIDEIVSGLPEALFPEAAEKLKNSQALIGLRGGDTNKPKVGLEDESSRGEILVEALAVVSVDSTELETGLICRSVDSMALYWLPSKEAALTTLFPEELDRIFVSGNKRKFKVQINRNTRYVSVLEVQDVRKQFRDLKIGKELTVKVVKLENLNKRSRRHLVESFTTNVILECETYDNEGLSDEILVEVIRCSREQKSITVVPAGKKRQYLDLPKCMTDGLPNPGERRKEFDNYLKWRNEEKDKKPTADDEQNLDRLLCYAYYDAFEEGKDKYPRFQVEVAKAWGQKNLSEPEINVACALIAILLLEKNSNRNEDDLIEHLQISNTEVKTVVSEWKKLACQMTQNLGQRAIRSMHIEVLYHNWLNNERNRRQVNGLWQRLQQIDQHLRLPQKQKIEKIIGKIRHFCDAVELRNTEFVKDILPISAGFSAALGELSNISAFYSENEAEVTRKLINFYRTLPLTQSGYQVPLAKSHINEIENLFNVISVNTLDIVLLDPLEGVYQSPVYRYEAVNLLAWLQDGSECKSSTAEFFNSPSKRGEYSKASQQLSLGKQLSQYCQTIQPEISEIEQNFERLRNLLKE